MLACCQGFCLSNCSAFSIHSTTFSPIFFNHKVTGEVSDTDYLLVICRFAFRRLVICPDIPYTVE